MLLSFFANQRRVHPNIVKILDILPYTFGKPIFYVMEYLPQSTSYLAFLSFSSCDFHVPVVQMDVHRMLEERNDVGSGFDL